MARKPKNMETEALAIADDFVIQKEFIELIDERFTNYAFAVMEDRALPDARDGLKPSQRRTLVAMNDLSPSETASSIYRIPNTYAARYCTPSIHAA